MLFDADRISYTHAGKANQKLKNKNQRTVRHKSLLDRIVLMECCVSSAQKEDRWHIIIRWSPVEYIELSGIALSEKKTFLNTLEFCW